MKQIYWRQILCDKLSQRYMFQLSSKDSDSSRNQAETVVESPTILDCSLVFPDNRVWIGFGVELTMKFYEIDVERGIMTDVQITVRNDGHIEIRFDFQSFFYFLAKLASFLYDFRSSRLCSRWYLSR